MTFAVLPAAGHSRRMGQPKLALPLGGRTVLAWVIQALRSAGVAHVLVVLGPHVAALAPVAEAGGAHVLLLPHATPDMRATVEAGLAWLAERFHPSPDDAWLLVPADHPTLDAAVVRQLLAAAAQSPGHSIFIPTAAGRRGHPALIAWKHVAGMRALPAGQGLNSYLRAHTDETCEVPVASTDVLLDLDTPEDYARLCAAFAPPPAAHGMGE